jgi:phospholipid/cholesterol/gamma-HCH transport system substrate-binding protein
MLNKQQTKVGLFVISGLALIAIAIIVLGGNESYLTKNHPFHSYFTKSDGLIPGAKVVVSGVPAGTVKNIEYDLKRNQVKVDFSVNDKFIPLIKKGTQVEILTQGVLGDKYLNIIPQTSIETESLPPLADNSEVLVSTTKGLSDVLLKTDGLMENVGQLTKSLSVVLKDFEKGNRSDTFFKNMTLASENLNQAVSGLQLKPLAQDLRAILDKVNKGQGTLGALINDPSLYEEAKALVGTTNRSRIIRNLIRKAVSEDQENNPDKNTDKK